MNVTHTENNKNIQPCSFDKKKVSVSQTMPHTSPEFSIEVCYLMMTEAAQDTYPFHFVLQFNSFPHCD
jgi:hypothetical protein